MQPLNTFVGSVVEERYRIEHELGAGAMGVVYRGRHIKVGRTVAIKVLHDHLVRNPEMVQRFEREAMLAARLRHKNLVAVIDLGVTVDGQKLMVLEYAPGENLASLVRAPMPRARVIDLTRQLLLGLEHAHALGLVHRDLKPENILVERTLEGLETPRIVDFGIAVLRDGDDSVAGRRLTSAGMVLGTPMYMSPEQARGELVDHRTDLFSLGVIVYELLAGKPPFEGSGVEVMMLNMMQDPPSVATRAAVDVDPLLEAFMRTLMARSADERFSSATAALEGLDLIDRDRDAAARALGVEVTAPVTLIDDAAITRRHVVTTQPARTVSTGDAAPMGRAVSIGDAAPTRAVCTRGAHAAVTGDEIETPSRRARWGAMLGAAAVVGSALAIALWMGRASRERPAIDSPHVEIVPSSDLEIEPEVRGTAMLTSPPPVSSHGVAPEDTSPMTPRLAVMQRVVIAQAGDLVFVVERFEREATNGR